MTTPLVPHTFTTDEEVTATRWNNETRNMIGALTLPPRAMLVRGSVGSWADVNPLNVWPTAEYAYTVLFDAVAYDLSYDGSRMVDGNALRCNIPGVYFLSAGFTWGIKNYDDPSIDGGTRLIGFGRNRNGFLHGGVLPPEHPAVVDSATTWRQNGALTPSGLGLVVVPDPTEYSTLMYLNRDDVVEMYVGQDAHQGPLESIGGEQNVFFSAVWVSD